ncbi:DDE superfamily endonuclease [Burkholderia sp. GAS332]|nr:DDE superfamily endonuclease [Burkholderia sp. GAS332]
MKADTLAKLQCAARDGQCRLFYFDEASFRAAPLVQRSWSSRGLPHSIEPNSHCKRSVVGALDFGENGFIYTASATTPKRPDVIEFFDSLIRQGDGQPTAIVLDNASIDRDTLDRWFIDHKDYYFYLPPYNPKLNLIEIIRKI